MLAKRIVPCLDIKDGKTVKGINFVNFRDAGDPVELGAQYSREGADELVYLDITASHEGRKTFTELVKKVAANISIPFTVGGGINELKDVDRLLSAGAEGFHQLGSPAQSETDRRDCQELRQPGMCGRHRRQFRNGRLDMLLERRTYSDGKTSLPVGGRS